MYLFGFAKTAASIPWNGRQPKSFEKDRSDQNPEGTELMWLDATNNIHDRLIPGAGVSPAALLPTFLDGEKSRPSETDTDRWADDSRQKNTLHPVEAQNIPLN